MGQRPAPSLAIAFMLKVEASKCTLALVETKYSDGDENNILRFINGYEPRYTIVQMIRDEALRSSSER
ncbi:hypothetical protein KIN20_005529 [Parelaphostrongylus tenuis]|uniref:Uncharacterized protein n=1 Tax=Parelaphostrongylus tenuis TaxID=148309 RepID=A0AAD5QHK7_PARTN|nr:hypothetical protein KIN20_005529 [Parelaphostrongylus tenuis]